MVHLGREIDKPAATKLVRLGLIEFVAHAKVEVSRDDGDALSRGVAVSRDFVPRRGLEAKCERTGFGGITGQHRHLRPFRESRWGWHPLELVCPHGMPSLVVLGHQGACCGKK